MSAFLPKTDVYRTSSQGGLFGFNSEFFAYEPVPPVRGEKRLEIRPSPFPSVATPQRAAMIGERVRVEASGRPDPISRNYGRYRARNRGAMVDTFDGALLRSRGNRFDRSGDCARRTNPVTANVNLPLKGPHCEPTYCKS